MAVWKTLRTQPSSADSFRITRIYSTPCTTTQPCRSGWVWGGAEWNGFRPALKWFEIKNTTRKYLMKYFQRALVSSVFLSAGVWFWSQFCFFWQQQTNKRKRRRWSIPAWLFWPEEPFFIPPLERKELGVKCNLRAEVFFLCRTKSVCSKNWREDQGDDNGYSACFVFFPSSFSVARNLIFKNAPQRIYDVSAVCKAMLPLTPCRASTPTYRDRDWTMSSPKNRSLASPRKRRKRRRPAQLPADPPTELHVRSV